jgi:hypothetical protein
LALCGVGETFMICISIGRFKQRKTLLAEHRASRGMLPENLYKGECEALVRKVITLGLGGDVGALKIAMDRPLPPDSWRLKKPRGIGRAADGTTGGIPQIAADFSLIVPDWRSSQA